MAALVVIVVLVPFGTGCGGDPDVRVDRSQVYSTREAIEHFRAYGGPTLGIDGRFSYKTWDGLTRRDGSASFIVIVINDDIDDDRHVFLDDRVPGGDGLFWDYNANNPYDGAWNATRQYGENVLLLWWTDQPGKTDETWTRLDSILRRLATPAVCRDCFRYDGPTWWEDQPYRVALATEAEKDEYDEAFVTCDPSVMDKVWDARSEHLSLLANVYGRADRDPRAIAAGLASAFAAMTRPLERTTHAEVIWRRGCLDALAAGLPTPPRD